MRFSPLSLVCFFFVPVEVFVSSSRSFARRRRSLDRPSGNCIQKRLKSPETGKNYGIKNSEIFYHKRISSSGDHVEKEVREKCKKRCQDHDDDSKCSKWTVGIEERNRECIGAAHTPWHFCWGEQHAVCRWGRKGKGDSWEYQKEANVLFKGELVCYANFFRRHR